MVGRNPQNLRLRRGVAAVQGSAAARTAGFGCLAVAGLLMAADADTRWLVFLLLAVGAVAVIATHGDRDRPS